MLKSWNWLFFTKQKFLEDCECLSLCLTLLLQNFIPEVQKYSQRQAHLRTLVFPLTFSFSLLLLNFPVWPFSCPCTHSKLFCNCLGSAKTVQTVNWNWFRSWNNSCSQYFYKGFAWVNPDCLYDMGCITSSVTEVKTQKIFKIK